MAQNDDLEDRVVYINRVSKAASGGATFSFSTMVAVGDRDGNVGIGIGRDDEVPGSIEKARAKAEKEMIEVPRVGETIPHEIEVEHDAARVLLKPASPGTGIIAGGAMRALIELTGIRDVLTKSLRSDNPLNIARATMEAFRRLKDPETVAEVRGIPLERILEDHPFAGPEDYVAVREDDAQTEAEETGESESSETSPEDGDDAGNVDQDTETSDEPEQETAAVASSDAEEE